MLNLIILGMFGGTEIIIIIVVILIFIVGSKSPEIIRSFGKLFNIYKKADEIKGSKSNILIKIIELFVEKK